MIRVRRWWYGHKLWVAIPCADLTAPRAWWLVIGQTEVGRVVRDLDSGLATAECLLCRWVSEPDPDLGQVASDLGEHLHIRLAVAGWLTPRPRVLVASRKLLRTDPRRRVLCPATSAANGV